MYKMDSNRWAVVGIVSWVFLNMLDFIHIYILYSTIGIFVDNSFTKCKINFLFLR